MITAKDLLDKAIDYDGFWNTSKQMNDSRPSKSRKLQIDKLLHGFGITKKNAKALNRFPIEEIEKLKITTVHLISKKLDNGKSIETSFDNKLDYIKTLTNFQYFSYGEFITDIDRKKYQNIIGQVITTTKMIFPDQSEFIDKTPINLVQLFSILYNFKLRINHLTSNRFKRRMRQEFSIEEDYSLYLTNKFMASLESNLSEVDEVLCMLIDPEKREFEKDEINYPNFDMDAIDKEWADGYFK